MARLVGLNLFAGRHSASSPEVSLDGGGSFSASAASSVQSDAVLVAVRPAAITVHTSAPEHASPRNVWAGTVAGMELLTDRVRLQVDGMPSGLVDVTADAVADLGLVEGVAVWLSAKATDVDVYAATDWTSTHSRTDLFGHCPQGRALVHSSPFRPCRGRGAT